jgi:hypothetical protein
MTKIVEEIVGQVRSLSESEREEFLSWLGEYEADHLDDWDKEIERDSHEGGRLSSVLMRVRADIASGKTRPLDEVIDDS